MKNQRAWSVRLISEMRLLDPIFDLVRWSSAGFTEVNLVLGLAYPYIQHPR